MMIGVEISAEVAVRLDPPTSDDMKEWQSYITFEIDNLHKRVDGVRQAQRTETAALRQNVDNTAEGLARTIEELRQQVPEAVGGKGGRGLEIAAWGVLFATVGTAVGAIG